MADDTNTTAPDDITARANADTVVKRTEEIVRSRPRLLRAGFRDEGRGREQPAVASPQRAPPARRARSPPQDAGVTDAEIETLETVRRKMVAALKSKLAEA